MSMERRSSTFPLRLICCRGRRARGRCRPRSSPSKFGPRRIPTNRSSRPRVSTLRTLPRHRWPLRRSEPSPFAKDCPAMQRIARSAGRWLMLSFALHAFAAASSNVVFDVVVNQQVGHTLILLEQNDALWVRAADLETLRLRNDVVPAIRFDDEDWVSLSAWPGI